MTTDLVALERDLRTALLRRLERRRRRRRRIVTTGVIGVVACGLTAAAIASGIAGDLSLDPTKWTILGGGSVDDGRGQYVHAQSKADESNSTFMVEHDAALPAYRAFLLHEKTLTAANETSPVPVRVEAGEICTASELTRAETVAFAALRAQFTPGIPIDAGRDAVDTAILGAFASSPCKGLEYAGEQARLVYAGLMPALKLMPGVH